MKTVFHLLRAALVGFLTLVTVGALQRAGELEKRDAASARAELEAPAAGSDDRLAEATRPEAGPRAAGRGGALGAMLAVGILGALVAVASTLLLMLFPVGPASKIVLGLVCAPALPLLVFAPGMLRRGQADDVGGILLIGLLVGLLAGILEANRVAKGAVRRGASGGE